jgi:hypothetical protein
MLIAEAHIETERASRYLVQLCQHVDKAGRAHPQMRAHVEWSDDRGVISLDRGRCTLRALPGVLTLRAEAPDEDTLRRVEHPIAGRLQQIGRRDRLTVAWTLPQGAGEETVEPPADATAATSGPQVAVMHETPDNHLRKDTYMSDPSRSPDTRGVPRWVMVVGIIVLIAALLYGVLELTGVGGGHGPGRHSSGAGGHTPTSSGIDARAASAGVAGHIPPAGGPRG